MENQHLPDFSQFVTKADLATTRADLERSIASTKTGLEGAMAANKKDLGKSIVSTRVHFENLLSDQTNVILEAVDERMDRKFDEKLHPVVNKLDYLIGSIESLKHENTVGAEQLQRHDDTLKEHDRRLKALELPPT